MVLHKLHHTRISGDDEDSSSADGSSETKLHNRMVNHLWYRVLLRFLQDDDEYFRNPCLEIDKTYGFNFISFKKIYKPTNNNLRTSSNASRANQDNSPRINKGTGYDNQMVVNVAGTRENVEKAVMCKQDGARVQFNAEQMIRRMIMYDESEDQILPQNVLPIFKNTNVITPGMYKVNTKPNQTRTPWLPQDIRKTNKHVSFSTGVIPTTSVSRPQLKEQFNRVEFIA
ncbi:hypothetical protein Tco_0413185 [Tanacetum coccineum]